MPRIDRLVIVGLGLIGGSLGMAARRHRVAARVIGVSRSASRLKDAKRLGAIDEGFTNRLAAVTEADVVVLATPVDAIVPYAKALLPKMPAGSVLTDVGSTKSGIVNAIATLTPKGTAFVGGHPIAGSEQRGLSAASARLFDGSVCVLTPTQRTPARALAAVQQLWQPLVNRVLLMSPDQHDRVLAGASHLPHALSFCLAASAGAGPLPHAPKSLSDLTRIAQSDPELWDDIFLSNRSALIAAMDRFDRNWQQLRRLIRQKNAAALRRFLARAQASSHAIHRQ
jgi:prephenate dehydrogenase